MPLNKESEIEYAEWKTFNFLWDVDIAVSYWKLYNYPIGIC